MTRDLQPNCEMENRSEVFWQPKLLAAVVTVTGLLGTSMLLPTRLADPKLPIYQYKAAASPPTHVFSVPARFQGKIVRRVQLPPKEKAIALTFDDGPWPTTTVQVLNILKQNNIKATFFWIGKSLQAQPDVARRVVADGHVIGNHTWHHWYFRMNPATAAAEIENTAKLIYDTTGVKTTLFRPPGGFMHNGVVAYALRKNYTVTMWSSEPGEFRPSNTVAGYVTTVLSQAQPGAIVLMHDGGGNHSKTVQALPQIIARLRQQGYRFVTVPELLEMQVTK
jgi:peptidoglycan-N-acetylglucosamine deacetylase